MRKHITYIFVALACVFISACNDDIFTEVNNLPPVTDVTVEGDGGEWSSVFSRDGLAGIRIDYDSHAKEYVRYYNTEGREVGPDCPASELRSIVYESPRTWYSVGFIGDMIYITSHYNASLYTAFSIQLEYESGETRYINVTITEGEKLMFQFWNTTGHLMVDENFEHSTHAKSMTNNTSITQRLEVMPFLEAKCSDMVMPADYWARGLIADVPMLTFYGNEWVWREYKDIELGGRRDFVPGSYVTDKISVDVPPNKKVRVTYKLNYSRATQDGVLTFSNMVSDQNYDLPVTWTSVYATSYVYNVEYE